MGGLRLAEIRSVLTFAEGTLAITDFGQVQPALAALTQLVGSDAATLTHLDLQTQHEVAVFWPSSRPQRVTLEKYPSVGASHPLRRPIGYQATRGPANPSPVRVSDVLTRRQWRSTPIYREVLTGVDDQMTLVLAAKLPAVHAVTLARCTGAFSDRQRDLLASCGRHLGAAIARARRDGHRALQIAPTPMWVSAADVPGLPNQRAVAARTVALSARESQVLELVAAGLTDAQVARQLELRPATVSKHLTRIYARLRVPNRAAAVRHWTQLQHSTPFGHTPAGGT